MTIKDRIGIDIGVKKSVEEGITWAAENGVRYVDFRLETGPDSFAGFTPERCEAIRAQAQASGITVGLHTLSAVNIAEISPHLAEGADQYLRTYIDIAKAIDASWVEVHAGYHFTSDVEQRKDAGRERLKRAVAYAEEQGVTLLLENMNWEPEHAEVHYLGHTLDECHYYFDAIDSPNLRWAFTVNHAVLVPEGIDGFIDDMAWRAVKKCGWRTITASTKITCNRARGLSTSATCFAALRATRISTATTCAPLVRWRRCWRDVTTSTGKRLLRSVERSLLPLRTHTFWR